jgi:F-type H+-transporting ATPase subunit b
MISTYALASDAEHAGTDIVQRTVNFILFVGLIWYMVAEPVKNYFTSRSKSIADDLKRVQDKLNESIALKKEAIAKISEAEKFAENLLKSAKKENQIINNNIMSQCDNELETIVKQNRALMEFEQRSMIRNVVENVLREALDQNSKDFDTKAMANVLLKKVA